MKNRLQHIITQVLQEEKILVPRHLETRDEEYKRIVYQKIQDYIKEGSKGDLNLPRSPITKLPGNLVKVGGFLNLERSQIQSLNNLRIVEGDLWLGNSQIQSLGNLKFVGEDLYLYDTFLKSLGNLQKIGGELHVEHTFFSKKYSKEEILQMVKDKGIEVKGKIYI